MLKSLIGAALFVSIFAAGVSSAVAAGGMGDPSTLLRQKNAICEMQRRGEGPRHPDMCLPEMPPGPVYDYRSQAR